MVPATDRMVACSDNLYCRTKLYNFELSLNNIATHLCNHCITSDYDTQADVHYEPDETETELHQPHMPVETRLTQVS